MRYFFDQLTAATMVACLAAIDRISESQWPYVIGGLAAGLVLIFFGRCISAELRNRQRIGGEFSRAADGIRSVVDNRAQGRVC